MSSHGPASGPALGLLVVDMGTGMAAALVARQLAEYGARVVRPSSPGTDPFDDVYPAHRIWRAGAEPVDANQIEELLKSADICIVGGEDLPELPGTESAQALRQAHPRLIVVSMGGQCQADAGSGAAVDLLAQARTGLVHEQFSARPICFAVPLPSYGSALLALIGLWAALLRRLRTGRSELVTSTLDQGVGLFWQPFWMEADHPDTSFSTITPKDSRHLIFACADGSFVQFVMGVPGAVAKLYQALNIDVEVDPKDRGAPCAGAPVDKYFGDLELIAAHVRNFRRDELLQRLWDSGLAAEPVLQPGECWDEAQVSACRLVTTDAHGWRTVGARPLNFTSPGTSHRPVPGRSARRSKQDQDALPLNGFRIVDLGNFVAGPFASRLLGDLGADVIKVESPSGSATISGFRTVYSSNCNKRSLCLDLKSAEGLAILADLCRTADVVHHNFRVGVAERLGVSPYDLHAFNPELVTLETTAYGHVGPKRLQPGFDMVMQAWCGHEARAGGEGNAPLWVRSPMIDYAAGALGAIAILMGLYQRETTGITADASVSLLSCALFLQSELVWSPVSGFTGAPLLDRELTGTHPAQALYHARDGWIAVAARDDGMAYRLASTLGLPSLPAARADWGPRERTLIARAARAWELKKLLDALRANAVWAQACVNDGWSSVIEARAGPLGARAEVVEDRRYGRVRGLVGTLVEFDDARVGREHLRAAPTLGEHTPELLQELGRSEAQVADLVRRRICSPAG